MPRHVAITGAARGIGAALARFFAGNGAAVSLLDIRAELGEGVAAELRAQGCAAGFHPCDVRDLAAVEEAAGRIMAAHGPVDGLITCAGINETRAAQEIDAAMWADIVATNLTGTFFCAQIFGRAMIARGEGAMVLVGSKSGLIVNRTAPHAHYNASKAAVIHLARCLAAEWAPFGVRVNCISPGYILTPMTEGRPQEHQLWQRDIPLGRLGTTDDLLDVTRLLLDRQASFITGQNIVIDGGFTLW